MDTLKKILLINSGRWQKRLDITVKVQEVVFKSGINKGLLSMYVQDKWAFVEVYKNNAVLIGLNDLWNFIKTWFNCGKYNDIMRFPAEGYYYEAEQYFINVPIIDGELDLPDNNSIFLIAFNLPREGLKVVCTFTDYS